MGRLPGTLWMRALLLVWFVSLICSRSPGLGVFRRETQTLLLWIVLRGPSAALAFSARKLVDVKTETEETVVRPMCS